MGKTILSLVAGILAAFTVIMFMEAISGKLYPLPATIDANSMESLKNYTATLPFRQGILLLCGYAIGAFADAFTATFISGILRQAFIIAMILMLSNTANLMMIPHPLWLAVTGTVIYFPFAWLGGKSALKTRSKRTGQ